MRRQRSRSGSAIAETGPALFMFLILIFFPMLDVMGMAAQYACAWYHNHLMLQELPVRNKADGAGNPVFAEIHSKFDQTGIAKFVGVTNVTDVVTYQDAAGGLPAMVRCTTTLEGKPFISLPFLGFTATKFTTSGEACREVVERSLSSTPGSL
jgi:hypothetical protein